MLNITSLNKELKYNEKDTILVWGPNFGFDKGTCNYINQIAVSLPDINLIVIHEAHFIKNSKLLEKSNIYYTQVPDFLFKDKFPDNIDKEITNKDLSSIENIATIQYVIDNISKRHPFLGHNYAKWWAIEAKKYVDTVLSNTGKIKQIILWNKFNALHYLVDSASKELKIPVSYLEFGNFPGTIAYETVGQMGESYPAREYKEFKSLDITENELGEAKDYLINLKETGANRNIQPSNRFENSKEYNQLKNKPIIFYAGQNDFESGLYPHDSHSKKFHSPSFSSSEEAMRFLSLLCIKNNWNLIYKPHPLVYRFSDKSTYEGYEHVTIVNDMDINSIIDKSDIVLTILSQVGYQALIRNKPLVMLGYTQLKQKECCYEAFNVDQIEQQIKKAIKYGFTNQQKKNFEKHTAQLLKYYLYNDLNTPDFKLGKSVNKLISNISGVYSSNTDCF